MSILGKGHSLTTHGRRPTILKPDACVARLPARFRIVFNLTLRAP
jgi:hypothetical protein